MTHEEIIEGNKTIAKFMGATILETPLGHAKRDVSFGEVTNGLHVHTADGLRYHSDWMWLMPVVEKIEAIRDEEYGWFMVYIHSNCCTVDSQHLWRSAQGEDVKAYMSDPNAIFNTKIESVWYNILKFIEWYNSNLKNK